MDNFESTLTNFEPVKPNTNTNHQILFLLPACQNNSAIKNILHIGNIIKVKMNYSCIINYIT